MKKTGLFFSSLVLYIGLLSCLFVCSEHFSPVYPYLKKRRVLFKAKADTIKILSLGNSHAGALHFNTLQLSGFHYWDPAEDIFETSFKIKEIVKHCPDLKVVCLPISPFLPYQNNSKVFYHLQYHPRVRVHVATPSWKPLQGKLNFLLSGKLSPILRYDHWAFLPKMLLRQDQINVSDPRLDSLETNGFWNFKYSNIDSEGKLVELAEKNMREHTRLITDTTKQSAFWDELLAIKAYLFKENIQLYLYTPPYYKAYLSLLDPSIYNTSIKLTREFAHKQQLIYTDFSNDSYISQNWQFFNDASHLNTKGREVFSQYVRADLERIKLFPVKENNFKNTSNQ